MAAKVKTEPEGIGHLFPIYDFEPIGAWAGRSIMARNERPANRQFSELSPLLAQPILPRALSQLMRPLQGLGLNLPALASDHSALRYCAAFCTPAIGHIIARDTVGNSSTALNWKLLGISPVRTANTRTPGVCEICLMEQKRTGQPPHWNIVFAVPGSVFCTRHLSPLLQACPSCRRANEKKKLWTMQTPEVRCHCGELRVEADLDGIVDFAFGVSQDVRSLLTGALDAYSSEQIFAITERRAYALDLQTGAGASRAREIVNGNNVNHYLSIAYPQASINESLINVVRGTSLASAPLVNVIGLRLLFGSLDGLVKELHREYGDGVPDRNELPVFFQRPSLDEQRLRLFRALAEGICSAGRLTSQQSFMATIGEEVAYAVAVDERWLRELFQTNHSLGGIRHEGEVAGSQMEFSTASTYFQMNSCPSFHQKNAKASGQKRETFIEVGGRWVSDTDLANKLRGRVAMLKEENPTHPWRTKKFMLKSVLHWTIYYRYHRRGELPALTEAIEQNLESKDEYRRRIYLHMAKHTPEDLHLDMPRGAARIQRATSEELKDWLRRLNIH